MKIRSATVADAEAIGTLIRGLSDDFLVDPSSSESQAFFDSLTAAAIAQQMDEINRFYLVAAAGSEVVGMIMVRGGSYIVQFFVAPTFQGRGVGRMLWHAARERALAQFNPPEFTVDSSLGAVGAYERLGFRTVGERTVKNGFVFIPMRLLVRHPAA
jgi:ribosomal protein S18 acetylase RimI-like enzyme